MNYTITINQFEGPLDLLLHLIKQSNLDIFEISIEQITKQYLDYILAMEKLNLNIASEYLVMAAELMEIKSNTLLPNQNNENNDEYEEDPREKLINRLLVYKQYKDITSALRQLEEERQQFYSKEPSNLTVFSDNKEPIINNDITLNDLINAFNEFLKRKQENGPLDTTITRKELSVAIRSKEIKKIIKEKKKIEFFELFEEYTKEYVIVTFLSILELAKKQEINIIQENNFQKIYITAKGCE
ncbi:MAG: segregation/condensation protein A [Mollicutes bacterium]|nr:segregation/condensation protein A [Mollicutes bacterium]